jgi:hypothetical protein
MKGEEKGWAYLLCARHRRTPGVSGAGTGGGGEGVDDGASGSGNGDLSA